ncbi:MAG: Rod shape-determining protein MreD [Catalinimonas sp.]
MNSNRFLTQVLYFVLLLGLQVLLFRNRVVFDYAFCFLYVGAVLGLPRDFNPLGTLLTAFGTGLLVDWFYDTLGVHAAATVLLAYLRPIVLRVLTPSGGYESNMEMSVAEMGWRWFSLYILPLILVHHLMLFTVEAFDRNLLSLILVKTLCSTAFTYVVLMLLQFAIRPPVRNA